MLKLRMCANLNRKIIHNQCEYNNDNFMYKIGLANWKIRPWILAKKRRLTMKNIFFTTSCARKKRNNYWTTYGISDSTKLLLLTLLLTTHCLAQQISSTESSDTTVSGTTTQSSELAGGSTITAVSTISPYLKPGESYRGKTSSTRLADTLTSVAVLVAIDNWTKWTLLEPENEMNSGMVIDNELPGNIEPGQSEMALFGKDSGISGVSGALTYRIDMHPKECEVAHYLQIMWSVPYNLNTYRAYFAVGVSDSYFNSSYSTQSLYNTLYYYTGTFERAEAGTMVEYTMKTGNDSTTESSINCKPIKVRGTMTPDVYKPIVAVSVLPTMKEDGFLSGKYFDDEAGNYAKMIKYNYEFVFMIIFNLLLLYYRQIC